MAKNDSAYVPLETIDEKGNPPASRLSDPEYGMEIVNKLIEANAKRSVVDSTVYGLISGNPPYSNSKLRERAESWRANFATRIGEATFNQAKARYEDIILKSPLLAEVMTNWGKPEEQYEWSTIITEEFEWLNQNDKTLVYNMFLSIHDLLLYRCGPVFWEHDLDFRFRAIPQRYVLVDDESPSTVHEWPLAVVRCRYTADQLYGFIQNPEAAKAVGWDVEVARYGIMHAAPGNAWGRGHRFDWEWYEQRMRNNDLYYGAMSEKIPVAWVFFREFPENGEIEGRITKCALLEDHSDEGWLFRKVRAHKEWQNFINPFYYDRGDGSHHSVKGYGIKGYALWSTYDRLQNHLVDTAFVKSSMHFQAVTGNDMQNLSVANMGPYMWHPPGGTFLQTQFGGDLDGPFAIKQDLLNTVTNNLAQYRPKQKQKGNPDTATEVEMDAASMDEIGDSQLVRFFEQLDDLWSERFRRAANPNLTLAVPGGSLALQFQKRCTDRGVPLKALQHIESVKAVRMVGYASPQARAMAHNRMLQRYELYDETGKRQILKDLTAADVGYRNVRLYIHDKEEPAGEAEQKAEATDKVAGMKVGVMPLVAPSQNPVIYATVYLKAADEAAGTLAASKGQTAQQVYSFLEVAGPAIAAQLKRFEKDPKRKREYETLNDHWKKLAGLHDKLGKQLKQQAQAQAKQQMAAQKQQQEGMMKLNGELMLKNKELEGKMALATRTKEHGMILKQRQADQKAQISERTARQKMAIADATAASSILINKATKRSAMKE